MITEDYVSFENAKLLKEKGFNELTPLSYSLPYGYESHIPCSNGVDTDFVSRITLQMAMKWLRETHNIDIAIYAENAFLGKRYSTSIWKDITRRDKKDGAVIVAGAITYEEAAETSIRYCLENLL